MENTLSINVINTAPYFYSPISSKRVGVNGQMTIDTLPSFTDYEQIDSTLTIYDAYYTINSVKTQIPDSLFSIVSS